MRPVVSRTALLISISLALSVACAVSRVENTKGVAPSAGPEGGIPDEIVGKAVSFITSRVGEDFCKKYVVFDPERSTCNPKGPGDFPGLHPEFAVKPSFKVGFWIRIPDKPYVKGRIEFLLDGNGKVLPNTRVFGLPDCVDHPGECNFPIDQSIAIDLAKNAGLVEGLAEWETVFAWTFTSLDDPVSGTYVWKVSNTLMSGPRELSGKTLVIDANSGEILDHMGWGQMWDY